MKNRVYEISKMIFANLIVTIMIFTSFSPIIVYAASTDAESSGATAGEASGASSYTLTADTMNVYYQGTRFHKYIFDGNANTNTYCLRGASKAQNNQVYTKRTTLDNADGLDESKDGLGFKGDSTKSVKAIKWIVKNMYYYTSETTANEKTIMKKNLLEIIKKYGGSYSDVTTIDDLSEDFIHTAQQFVIWKYVNHNSAVDYYGGGLTETKLSYFTTTSNTSSKLNDAQKREMMAIYTALYTGSQKVYNGESNVYTMNETKQTLSAKRNGTEILIKNNHYLLGPITLTTNALSKVNHTVSVNNKVISKSNYKFTDANGTEKTIKSGEAFYIDITSAVGQNPTTIKANYKCSLTADPALELEDCYVYSGGKIYNQPILQVQKKIVTPTSTPTNYAYSFQVKEIDLALTKQITKIKRKTGETVYESTDRFKSIDKTPLLNGETDAIYIMNKTPLVVQPGDEITYKMRIFNEGKVDAIAKSVTDYLPDGLNASGKSDGKVIITLNGNTGVTIKSGESYDNIFITCTVAADVKLGTVLQNVAEISDYGYNHNGTYINSNESDIDSTQGTITNNTVNIASGANVSSLDIRAESSIEDDDDFEQVRVGRFDLALRKFITNVNNPSDGVTKYDERTPKIDANSASRLVSKTTAYYYHTKTPVTVKRGDIIRYTIRIYNEGEIDGYAQEITDYLPVRIKNNKSW